MRVSENFVPISNFKARATDWLRRAEQTGAPIVVTQNGRPAGVLLSPEAFDRLTEQARFVSAVREGLDDADAGRVQPHAEVQKRIRRRFGGR